MVFSRIIVIKFKIRRDLESNSFLILWTGEHSKGSLLEADTTRYMTCSDKFKFYAVVAQVT